MLRNPEQTATTTHSFQMAVNAVLLGKWNGMMEEQRDSSALSKSCFRLVANTTVVADAEPPTPSMKLNTCDSS